MKTQTTILLLLMILVFFNACNLDRRKSVDRAEIEELKSGVPDTVTLALGTGATRKQAQALKDAMNDTTPLVQSEDSSYFIPIAVPEKVDMDMFDLEAYKKFNELAKATGGEVKLLVHSKMLANEIVKTILSNSDDGADILFLIDKTGSMADDIVNIRKGLHKVLLAVKEHQHVRVAIAFYGDKNVDYGQWFSFNNFEEDLAGAQAMVDTIQTTGGGDAPESVYDGFFRCCQQGFWKSQTKRMVVLIGDAPPLDKPLSEYTLEDVVQKATDDKIKMNFYPIIVTPYTIYEDAPETKTKSKEAHKMIAKLYPNPASSMVSVELNEMDNYHMEIINMWGMPVRKETIWGTQWKADVSGLTNGTYIIQATASDNKVETIKFVVAK